LSFRYVQPWLKIDAISGTSAGAMNAAVLVSGFIQDGAQGARARPFHQLTLFRNVLAACKRDRVTSGADTPGMHKSPLFHTFKYFDDTRSGRV
jgi:predicted acylesterase/phospholipase RssA